MAEETDLDAVADELYGLPRDDFVARRDELAKAARAAGDKQTATAIGTLRKPSQAAWLANLVARDHPEEVAALEELGASLRTAQEQLEGDALRTLSRQRHDLVNAMVTRGRRIARGENVKIGESVARELERTVMAALADSRAARALAAGRLVTSLEPGSGLGDDDVAVPGDRPARRPPPRRAATEDASDDARDTGDDEAERQERVRREQALDEARAAADAADTAAASAREEADAADSAHHEAADVVRDLRERLDAAERDERTAADRAADARDARDDRDREARRAADALDRAQRRLADLDA